MDGPTLALISIMGGRVLFDLRSEGEEPASSAVDNVTTVEFANGDAAVRSADEMETETSQYIREM